MHILREHIHPHYFPVEQGHSAPLSSIKRPFLKDLADDQQRFLVRGKEIYCGASCTWQINDQIMPRVGEFQECIIQ